MQDQSTSRGKSTRWILFLLAKCVLTIGILAIITYTGFIYKASSLTVGCLYLTLVMAMALFNGFWQASLTSIAALLMLDYCFIPPIYSLELGGLQDYITLASFEVIALVISRLHAKERKGTREAAVNRTAMEQLYELSRSSLLLDMRQSPGAQLVVLIHRIFGLNAVALFDVNLERQDRAGEWDAHEENIARECYLAGLPEDDAARQISRRILMIGQGPVGALVLHGEISPLVVDALASLSALAIDRHQSLEKEERAENASKSEQLRAAVMDALAHEFKTPLTAVQTASSGLLEMGGLTDMQRNLATLIDDETTRLNKLCTRLLLTARLEAVQVGLQMDAVNVKSMIMAALDTVPAEIRDDRIQIAVDDPLLTVDVDRELLTMILTQYLNNAAKYSDPDTPIEISARKSHSEVLFSVHNIGPTIRIEDRERIFDRFYRSSDQKDRVQGTGIGLSVVRKAAEAHHGHVWVISDDVEGTTFFLSLPTGGRRKQ
jgi:two-component system, OmpR family, sensor histidine kinase KdpD